VLTDFDASQDAEVAASGGSTTTKCTVEYAAPEVLAPGGTASDKSDIWSTGQLLHYCCVGSVAKPQPNGTVAIAAEDGERFPEAVRAAVIAMLHPNPDRRPTAAQAGMLPCFSQIRQQLDAALGKVAAEQRELAVQQDQLSQQVAENMQAADTIARDRASLDDARERAEAQHARQARELDREEKQARDKAGAQQAELDRRQAELETDRGALTADVAASKRQLEADRQQADRDAQARQDRIKADRARFQRDREAKEAAIQAKQAAADAAQARADTQTDKLKRDAVALKRREAAAGTAPPWYWKPHPPAAGARRVDVTAEMKGRIEWLMNSTARPQTHGSGRDTHGMKFDTFKVVLYALCSMPYARCSMLDALCSMRYALCFILTALSRWTRSRWSRSPDSRT